MTPKTKFFLQDGWVYFKIYCDEINCEIILNKFLRHFINTLNLKKLIEKYFFIRYRDENGFHIRVRFHCYKDILYHQIIDLLLVNVDKNKRINNLIISIQIDTYEKEIIRYGKKTIAKIEQVFCIDSMTCLHLLEVEKDINIRWLKSVALVSLYIKLANLSIQDSFGLMEKCADSYLAVFSPDKKEFSKINEFYAKNKKQIYKYCEEPEANLNLPIQFVTTLTNHLQEIKQLTKIKNEPDLKDVYKDIIHMSLNRFLPSNPNKNEFVIYELLKIFYKSSLYKSVQKRR